MLLQPTHLSLHDASQLFALRIAIVSGQIGAQSHGHFVARFATTCRIAIASHVEAGTANASATRTGAGAGHVVVKFACTLAITGTAISNAALRKKYDVEKNMISIWSNLFGNIAQLLEI